MSVWSLQDAKAKLSEVVKLCENEPQVISLRGTEKVIMMTIEEYENLLREKGNLVSFLSESPLKGIEIELDRDSSASRDVEI